ncbi:flavin reductase family protein [Prauserella alba]|uniref:Flavin reductase family protein n=1 Tax=Prauserella alba TaxID=176898 RepID=A0ABP4G5U7_9PSEU|nr:flavin reductase family protein [Prauserella alba]MCP2182141.1 NADH-FMN oxidoreductase RutF, flavin reductase (DIM6/NTAB) family [Prauserella alba]
MTLDPRLVRDGFGRFATGVTVVSCAAPDGTPHGATVNAFTAVSLEPALCQVTLTRTSKAGGYLTDAPFAVNILSAKQQHVAWHFAGKPQERPPEWAHGPTAPVLLGNAATISCRPWRVYDGGDHVLVLGEVADIEFGSAEPLLFFGGRFHELGTVDSQPHWVASMDCPEASWFGLPSDVAFSRIPA